MPKLSNCKILELKEGCSLEDAKQSYRKLSREYHPDKNLKNTDEATTATSLLNNAYEELVKGVEYIEATDPILIKYFVDNYRGFSSYLNPTLSDLYLDNPIEYVFKVCTKLECAIDQFTQMMADKDYTAVIDCIKIEQPTNYDSFLELCGATSA